MSNGRYPLLEATGRGLEHAYRMTESAFGRKQAFEYGRMMAREQAELQLEKQKEISELSFLISAFTGSKTISGRQFYGEKLQGKTGWNVLQNLDESVKLLKDIEAKGKDDPQTAIKMLTSVPDLIGTIEAKGLLTRAGMELLGKPGATEEETRWGRFGLTEAGVKPEEVIGKREKPSVQVSAPFQDEEGRMWVTKTIDGKTETVPLIPGEATGPTTTLPSGVRETPLGPPSTQLKGKAKEEKAPTEMVQFELETGMDPQKRGTKEYQEKINAWRKEKKEAIQIITPFEQGKFAATLRKEFEDLRPVKDYRDTTAKFNIMKAAFKESQTTQNFVAVDQALITLFNKMTDPQSVVRESEYIRTPSDLALWNRLRGKVQKFVSGGPGLTHEDRKALIDMASKFMKEYTDIYKVEVDRYRKYATMSGMDPNQVVETFAPSKEKVEGKSGRDRAIKTLEAAGYPITEANIESLMKSQGWE